jgi:hypothetical protein
LIQTTPLVDISHWNIDPNLKVKIYDIKGKLLGSFKSLRVRSCCNRNGE